MGLNSDPSQSGGMMQSIKAALGLFSDENKAEGFQGNQNPLPRDEYESSLKEEEIIKLKRQWQADYQVYFKDIEDGQKLSFNYWVGKHRDPFADTPYQVAGQRNTGVTDNRIFKAIETFLPVATRANPDPLVQADPSDAGQEIAKDLKNALISEADKQQLRRKLAKTTRQWMLNRIGVVKVSWNPLTKKIETNVINPKRMILDRNGYVNENCQFIGEYEGERKNASAQLLTELFPKKAEIITKKAGGKMATVLDYIEWWYRGRDVFYTLDDIVLGKYKNPNWNYDIPAKEETEAVIDPETGMEIEPAQEAVSGVEATNHLDEPTSPYRYLAIFSTSEQPHDNTSLILQNIPQQDKINRREVQIDQNVQGMNNGVVVSGTYFTEEQASGAAAALRRGMAIRQPSGDVRAGVAFPQKPSLPKDVFESLQDARNELDGIFGVTGLTSEGVKQQDTVRGKIIVNQADSSRIGGGITEYIEQLADSIYNLWVQFMFVYYDTPHYIAASGATGGMELSALDNSRFPLLKTLRVTVKEGSLIPKDPLTQRNEAIDLWSANAIDPLSLYKKLDFPNPQEATNQLILWQLLQKGAIQPQQYLQSFAFAGQTANETPLPTQQPGTGGPAVSPPPNQGTENTPTQPGSPEAVAQESKQLLQSTPIQRV